MTFSGASSRTEDLTVPHGQRTAEDAVSDPVPEITVAIATRQRAHLLPSLIRSFEQQTLAPDRFEVVFVDDGSTDGSAELLRDIGRRSRLRIHVERFTARRGQASARNAAWRRARAGIIAFTDDDCRPTPTWLETGLDAMRRHGSAFIGRVIPDPEQMDRWGPFSHTATVNDARFASSGNAFYRRDDLEAVGGFDEDFAQHGGEDTDLGWRTELATGRRIGFLDDAVVYHEVTTSDFLARMKYTLRWDGVPHLVARHPEAARRLLHRRIFWKGSHPKVMLAAAGLMLAARWPAAAVLTAPWLRHRVRHALRAEKTAQSLASLPGVFVLDLLEVYVMVRGSIRHRTVVL